MTTNHDACCCTETQDHIRDLEAAYGVACHAVKIANRDRGEMAGRLNQALTNYLALRSAYWAANCDRDELTNALAAAVAERDRARDTAARLEAELARGFHTAAPDITLSRDSDGPATPNNPDPGDRTVQIRPGSEITSADTHPLKNGPEGPSTL